MDALFGKSQAAREGPDCSTHEAVGGAAKLTYRTADPQLVSHLNAWFDAQLSDNGADACPVICAVTSMARHSAVSFMVFFDALFPHLLTVVIVQQATSAKTSFF